MKKKSRHIFYITIAAVLLSAGGAGAFVLSGGDYELESSVVDNGGGQQLSGGAYSSRGAIAQASLPDNAAVTRGGVFANRTGFYSPPHFVFQEGLLASVSMPGGEASLSLPPFSVDKLRFDITMNRNPLNQPMSIDPAKINEANEKIVHNDGSWSQVYSSNLAEMAIFDEQDFYTRPLAKKGTLTMAYKDENNDGILDGSSPPVRVNTLSAWGLDQTHNTWVELPWVNSDPSSKMFTGYFDMPGVYAMIGAQDLNISRNFKAYPVPFRPNGPQAGSGLGQTGTEAEGITFENAPQAGNIEIYTLDGRLVRKLGIPDNITWPYRVNWDVKTAAGGRAASGVYIWRVVSGSNAKTGKLMVIW
ncbi:MAG: hypothetical protein A2021_02290 [Elusimicrobia bacterium GWF2_52_66]|nr:MAG: hypothetical protein A2X33_08315 [Elusimicrobia bacterium GWA2_51_34]OGR85243.1 MAG: hypothetical protein A2021_02290 [Elusimicrobia bacterium GWF2_52_66]HAF95246.1 hypothetical protein [Elusimicrobiota bacterium]HCE97324.1 hypothetical protein [Elusimicrobiota bacterium]